MGLVLEIRRPFPCIKSSILHSYCVVGMITSELPLSALAIIASLSSSFFMFFRVLDSERVLCVCGVYCFFVGCLCVLQLVFCMSLVAGEGGLIRQFLPLGLGFESRSWACHVGCILGASAARPFLFL